MEILRLLIANREMYGLEMVKASDKLPRGTIYVTLARMIDKGFVTAKPIDDPNIPGLPRQMYRITDVGYKSYDALRAAERALAPSTAAGVLP